VLNVSWKEFNEGMDENDDTESTQMPTNWQQSFKGVIENLGLSAASEEASAQGIQLTGREKEQEKIMTFLRSRIGGDVDDDDESDDCTTGTTTNASLFVAGPPGTGKTASVNSAIARLRKEQAKGKLPAFQFVSLNGMEMRHPFEAYVKFWEKISGPDKQKCPPEVAVAKLERHFAGRGRQDGTKSSQIVVLLLDEIDYLVTKKQTVLYNFFDWPRRTLENGSGPRLIVIGISNTLNLPSRLKPSVQSRLGSETCAYKSYNVKDMNAILKTKIQIDTDNDVSDALRLLLLADCVALVLTCFAFLRRAGCLSSV
jgi:origin recognition complex subunit 1